MDLYYIFIHILVLIKKKGEMGGIPGTLEMGCTQNTPEGWLDVLKSQDPMILLNLNN